MASGGSIVDYASLQTAIANWLHRTDLTAQIPDFIALAETRLSGDLYLRLMESTSTLTTIAGVQGLVLPDGFTETRALYVQGNSGAFTALQYKSIDQLIEDCPDPSITGLPTAFAVYGSVLMFAPTPDSAYTVQLIFKQAFTAAGVTLSALNTTNPLLLTYPEAYLWASLANAAAYTGDPRGAVWEKKYKDVVDTLNGIDWYSGSTPVVRHR